MTNYDEIDFSPILALSDITKVRSKDDARLVAQLGHKVLGMLGELGVPSFAFVNGLALGGGLEIALNSSYRTVDASAAAIALPEVFLGIIPGWGGAYLLPNLITTGALFAGVTAAGYVVGAALWMRRRIAC